MQCGKAVGIFMDSVEGGWKRLIEYAQSLEEQDRTSPKIEKLKRKRVRKLHSLSCFVNYDRIKVGQEEKQSSRRGGRRLQGVQYQSK